MSKIELDTKHLKSTKSYRYVTLGHLSKNTKYLWFLLHGSHMLCEQMAYKFSDFDLKEHFIVSAEGGNRFYANGFGGEVVASWMTSRDRLLEIEDFSNFLTKLYHKYYHLLSTDSYKIVLGFSQGATTSYRWLHAKNIDLDYHINYSGWIPEDINLKESKTNLDRIKMLFTYGLEDQFLTDNRIEVLKEIIGSNKLDISILPHKNTHKVSRIHLQYILEKYL